MTSTLISTALKALNGKAHRQTTFFKYYDGQTTPPVVAERLREVYQDLAITVVENWAQVVIDALMDRIVLNGLTSQQQDAQDELKSAMDAVDLAMVADDAHLAALICGESYVIAWRDDKRDGDIECYYNDPRMCHIEYDTHKPNTPLWGAKWWTEDERHIVIYTPNEITEYTATDKSADVMSSKFKEVRRDKNPHKQIPIFHLQSIRSGRATDLQVAMPLQDMLNIMLTNMIVTAEFAAAPLKYIITNAEGVEGLKTAPNRIWHIPTGEGGATPSVGQLPAAGLGEYMNAIDHLINAIAALTRTPRHYFYGSSSIPSGDALRAMEAPLVKKARRRMTRFSATWRNLGAFLCTLQGVNLPPSRVTVDWENPETVQPNETAQQRKTATETVKARVELGVTKRQGLRELGFTDEQITAMEQEAPYQPQEPPPPAPPAGGAPQGG